MDKVIEKVQKLLNLADKSKNSSDAEAENAMLMAQKLLAKHGLEMADVAKEALPEYAHEVCDSGWNRPYRIPLALTLSDNFRCKVYLSGKQVVFFGHEVDAKIAKETFEFLYNYIGKAGTKLYNKHYSLGKPTKGVFNSYAIGFIHGIKEKLGEQSQALMIITPPDVIEKFEDETKDLETRRERGIKYSSNAEAYSKGVVDGRDSMSRKSIAK